METEIIITQFEILGLHEEKTIIINFDNKGKILVGENGSGKTTILNMFYYFISKKFVKLLKFKFKAIVIYFGETPILLTIEIIKEYLNLKKFHNRFTNTEREKYNTFYEELFNEYDNLEEFTKLKNAFDILENKFYIYEKENKQKFSESFKANLLSYPSLTVNYLDNIMKKINMKILYLPTYRRVDENLKLLGNTSLLNIPNLKTKENILTQFSMESVNEKIKELEYIIDKKTQEGYINLTKNVLKSFAKNECDIELLNKIYNHKNKIDQVLSKFEDSIEQDIINEIMRIVNSKEELNTRKDLAYFISGLITIYDHIHVYEKKLKDFMDKCNEYLTSKKFNYYSNKMKLILEKENLVKTPLKLDDLSSGEKQIIAIFCKIYLENDEDLFIIFDEPELSLSVLWQEKILVDIYNSDKCKFLLSATHSPFIYDNELEKIVDSIEVFTFDYNNNPY